jgi:ATP-dependent Clp protease protease subunit
MIHQPEVSGLSGQATDIEIHAKEILTLKQRLGELLSKHTGQTMEKINADTDRNYFMSAQEAKEYGIIDEVIDKRR